MTRPRQLVALTGRVAQLVPWWHVLIGGAPAFAYVGIVIATTAPGIPTMLWAVRIGMIPLAASAAFVFEDPTEAWLAATPVSVRLRRVLRLALLLPVLVIVWVGLLAFAGTGAPAVADGAALPVGGLSLEFAGVVGVVVGVAGLSMWRETNLPSGLVAGPMAPAVAVVAAFAPAGLVFWADWVPAPPAVPLDDLNWRVWVAAHQRWAAVAAVGLVGAWWSGRDRGARTWPTSTTSTTSTTRSR